MKENSSKAVSHRRELRLAYLIGSYPRLTTTFIEREIEVLREMGVNIRIISLRRPSSTIASSEKYQKMHKEITYLIPVNWPLLILAHLFFLLTRPVTYLKLLAFLVSRPHPNLKARLKTAVHFAEGVLAAYHLRDRSYDHLHVHFIDRAGTVAICIKRLLQLPYSLTAHARSIFADPVLVREKIAEANFFVTVSEFNKAHILQKYPELDPDTIFVLHPWVELSQFQSPETRPHHARLRLLSVGRLVEKKGHRYLIEACHLLQQEGIDFEGHIIGDGPLETELAGLIRDYQLEARVQLLGGQPQSEVLAHLNQADIFVLACVVAKDGDRDGIPVSLAEAMAMQVPVVSTNIVGIGELIRPGTGYMVPAHDARALADAIKTLASAGPASRREMGRRGREVIADAFALRAGIRRLITLFEKSVGRKNEPSSSGTFARLRDQSLFLVWGPPSHGPRSRIFADSLGIEELHFIHSVKRRGLLAAPLKYTYQALHTLLLLFRKRPRLVFIQSPPSIAVLFVYLYCALSNGHYVVDAHSDALLSPYWSRPRWLHHFLARKAVTTIVTNEHFQQMIHGWGGHAFVLRDIPTTFSSASPRPTNGAFTVVVVNSYAADEPLEEVLDAAADIDGVQFYVTGKKSRGARRLPATLPDNVHLTGFLPEDDYYALLDGSQAVMCLTTRDHTMQRGACEALSLGKPIITSDWPILQNYFRKGTVHVDNTAGGIRQGIVQMQMNYKDYQAGIKELQREQQEEWRTRISLLTTLIEESLAAKSKL